MTAPASDGGRWWESRGFAAAAIFLSAVPLIWPSLPPLNDLPGHIGRYHIAAAIGASPDLARHWALHWAPIGNLGVDLLVQALAPLMPVEAAARLVVTLIPPLWVSGLILFSRVSGGRVGPAVAFGFPLAYAFPLQFGFVNFMLSAGLAIHALALWIWLGRCRRPRLRAFLFVPISFLLWLAHVFGWGIFGLAAFATELVRLRGEGRSLAGAALRVGLHCLVLIGPLPLMWFGPHDAAGVSWDLLSKFTWFVSLLRERWKWYDVACAAVLLAVAWAGVREARLRMDASGGAAALICMAAFALLPRLLGNGSYVDMRMWPVALAFSFAAIRVRNDDGLLERRIALAATAFFLLRTITSTIAMLLFAQGQREALAVVPQIPRGAGVLVLVNEPCSSQWSGRRLGHIAGIAVARRDIFENEQWTFAGQQLLSARHPEAAPYAADPSQLVYPASCDYRTTDFDQAIRDFDRHVFGYVWTLDFAARRSLAPDVRLQWSNGVSALYKVSARPRLREDREGR